MRCNLQLTIFIHLLIALSLMEYTRVLTSGIMQIIYQNGIDIVSCDYTATGT